MRHWLPALLAIAFITGCESTKLPEAYNVNVHLADSLRDAEGNYPSVDVFIKGASEWKRTRDWSPRPNIVDYPAYRSADASNGGAQILTVGGEKRNASATLASNHVAWKVWSDAGAMTLIIIANYPRTVPPGGDHDRRMIMLPLDRTQYPDNNLLIDVTQNGLELRTPPRPAMPH